jgi:hypothetical protein
MLAKIGALTGKPIDIGVLMRAFGLAGAANVFGRQLFIEFARAIGWGTGMGITGTLLLGGFGATTAAMQTFLVGWLAFEISRATDGTSNRAIATFVIRQAKAEFAETYSLWKREKR